MDRAKLDASSENDIARQVAEDPDTTPEITLDMLIAPKNLRRRLDMTQNSLRRRSEFPLRRCAIGSNAAMRSIRPRDPC